GHHQGEGSRDGPPRDPHPGHHGPALLRSSARARDSASPTAPEPPPVYGSRGSRVARPLRRCPGPVRRRARRRATTANPVIAAIVRLPRATAARALVHVEELLPPLES